MKYRAIKLIGFKFWIWFEADKITTDDSGAVIGKGGWGKGGAHIDLDTHDSLIESNIYSDELQFR